MNFVYLCTRSYLRGTLVSIQSVLTAYAYSDSLHFYVLSIDEFTDQDASMALSVFKNIELITVRNYAESFKASHPEFEFYFNTYSDIAFLKAFVPDYMHELGIVRACYLDVDTIMVGNVNEAYEKTSACPLQAVSYNAYAIHGTSKLLYDRIPEFKDLPRKAGRVNDGVLFINSDLMMKCGWIELRTRALENYLDKMSTHIDVDLYSMFMIANQDAVTMLDPSYNVLYSDPIGSVRIIHYAGICPWSTSESLPTIEMWRITYCTIKDKLNFNEE